MTARLTIAARMPTTQMIAGALAVAVLALVRSLPLVLCRKPCFADFSALSPAGDPFLHLRFADSCLNSWILAWVGHALTTAPASIFDANAFYPTARVLAGSEHLIGVAATMLPLDLVTDSAVAVHQAALVFAYVGTALATFALARWLTGSTWAAVVAGGVAALLPWRYSELEHLQLQSTTWFPLVWLLVGRLAYGRASAGAAALLALLVLVQALTSYYLAYMLIVSCLVLIAVLALLGRLSSRAFLLVLLAVAVPVAVVAVISLPYAQGIDNTLVLRGKVLPSVPLSMAWDQIAPPIAAIGTTSLPGPRGYHLPLLVVLLAIASLLALAGRRTPERLRRFTLALWLMAAAAFVLSIGTHATIGSTTIPLPASLMASLVPGFAHFRAPLRWGILICLVAPLLAGIGIAAISTVLERAGAFARSERRRAAVHALIAIGLLLGLAGPRIPTAAAYRNLGHDLSVYDVLRELPPAPVLEWPWPLQADWDAWLSAEYMLASTRHWRPILNGYTGYTPRTYDFLRRVAQGMPAPAAIARLSALTGVRWIVVHTSLLDGEQLDAWDQAPFTGKVVLTHSGEHARIYEISERGEAGAWRDALLSAEPRERTFAGLERTRLVLRASSGRIQASAPAEIPTYGSDWVNAPVAVRIENRTEQAWPGLDIDPRGLVAVQQTLVAANGKTAAEASAPLDDDVPAGGALETTVRLATHVPPGSYRLRVDLVQRVEDEEVVLPIARSESRVRVVAGKSGT